MYLVTLYHQPCKRSFSKTLILTLLFALEFSEVRLWKLLQQHWCCWQEIPKEEVWILSYLFLPIHNFFPIHNLKTNEKANKAYFWLTILVQLIPFYLRREITIWYSMDMCILKIEKSDMWKRSDWQLWEWKACTNSANWTWTITVQFSLSLPN